MGESRIDNFMKKIRRPIFIIMAIIGVAIIIDIPAQLGKSLFLEQNLGVYITLFLLGTFISKPFKKDGHFTIIDVVFAVLSVPAGLYLTIMYPKIALMMGRPDALRIIIGALAILLTVEALRRSMGLSLTIVVGVFLLYAKFASYMPGVFRGQELTIPKLINYIYVDPNSLLYMLGLAATVGAGFIFFGQLLIFYGGGEAFVNLAYMICGRMRGGSAKAAVLSSSLVGTITGAPMTNVLLAGTFTIPMMKKSGYTPTMAAAIEALASSGGQIMPPVMGIAAFIIADTLGLPYARIALAAAIPAILYYYCIFMQVDAEADKLGILRIDPKHIPSPKQALTKGWFIFPAIAFLVITLFVIKLSPAVSAIYAGFLSIPFFYMVKANRKDFFKTFLNCLEECGKLIVNIAVIMASAGLVVGAINATGLGFNLTMALVGIAKGNLVLLLLAAAISSLILGMGLPSVAAYSLVAVLIAPSIINMGITPLAAHLFVFYFSVISNITPPVAVAVFAAAPLAGANPTKTGYMACRLGISAYFVPFAFVFMPELLFDGPLYLTVLHSVFMILAITGMCLFITAYFAKPMSWIRRIIFGITSLSLFYPHLPDLVKLVISAICIIALMPDVKEFIRRSKDKSGNLADQPMASL